MRSRLGSMMPEIERSSECALFVHPRALGDKKSAPTLAWRMGALWCLNCDNAQARSLRPITRRCTWLVPS